VACIIQTSDPNPGANVIITKGRFTPKDGVLGGWANRRPTEGQITEHSEETSTNSADFQF
jgi:hypothetical protein